MLVLAAKNMKGGKTFYSGLLVAFACSLPEQLAYPHNNADAHDAYFAHDNLLVLQPHGCKDNVECPPGSTCLHGLCFWSHCLATSVGPTSPPTPTTTMSAPRSSSSKPTFCSIGFFLMTPGQSVDCQTKDCSKCLCTCLASGKVDIDCPSPCSRSNTLPTTPPEVSEPATTTVSAVTITTLSIQNEGVRSCLVNNDEQSLPIYSTAKIFLECQECDCTCLPEDSHHNQGGLMLSCKCINADDACEKPPRKKDHCFIDGQLYQPGKKKDCLSIDCNRCECECPSATSAQAGVFLGITEYHCGHDPCPPASSVTTPRVLNPREGRDKSCVLGDLRLSRGESSKCPSEDGCNECKCVCSNGGRIKRRHCTNRVCPQQSPSSSETAVGATGGECTVDGKFLDHGNYIQCEALGAGDCNACICVCHQGQVLRHCTELQCGNLRNDLAASGRGDSCRVGGHRVAHRSIHPCPNEKECNLCMCECIDGEVTKSCTKAECSALSLHIPTKPIVFDYEYKGDILDILSPATTAEWCQNACQEKQEACRYWSFSGSVDDDVESSSSSCTLLSSVTHIAFKCGAISGRRNGLMNCDVWRGAIVVGGFERNYLPQRLVTDQPCQDANSREEFLGEDASGIPEFPLNMTIYGGVAFGTIEVSDIGTISMGVCGGYSGEFIGTGPKCFGLLLPVQREEKAKWVELAQMSSGIMGAAAVTLDEKVWVLGGKVGHNGKPSATSEVYDGKHWTQGPDGPNRDGYEVNHCMVQLSRRRTLLIGGEARPKESWIYNSRLKKWRRTGDLTYPRSNSACTSLPERAGSDLVAIVVGGEESKFSSEVYHAARGKWLVLEQPGRSLEGPRVGLVAPCLVRIGCKVLLIGGLQTDGDASDKVYVLKRNGFSLSHRFSLHVANYKMMCTAFESQIH